MAVITSTSQKRNAWIAWLDHCAGRKGAWANPNFFGKTIGGVPEPWADAILALEMALRATGYTPKSAWAYNFRGISGAKCTCLQYGNCSLHSNGISIDIDPVINPYISTSTFRWSDTAFTPAQIAAVERIKNTKGEQLWSWGGRWNTVKDYMHFEANVDPGSTAVDWSTVPGATNQVTKEDDMTLPLQYGDGYATPPADAGVSGDRSHKAEDVRRLQDRFNKLPGADIALDGLYGPATIARAKAVGGTWTGYDLGKQGKWWGGNQDGELDWHLALQAASMTASSSGEDSVARSAAAAAQSAAESALALAKQIQAKLRDLF